MFEQRPHTIVVPESVLHSSRTQTWIMTVPNRAFLPPAGTRSVAETRARIAPLRRPADAQKRSSWWAAGAIAMVFALGMLGALWLIW